MPVTIQPATLRYKANGEYLVADSIKGDKGDPGRTGATPHFVVGSIVTGEAGSDVSVTITGTDVEPVINMSVPKGDKGDTGTTPHFSVGTVETGVPGTNVNVTITGTPEAPVLNMSIPRGASGPPGAGTLIAPDYYELIFPVEKGQHCIHDAKYYEANTDIATSEDWTLAHWTHIGTIGDEMDALATRLSGDMDDLRGIVNKTSRIFDTVSDMVADTTWMNGQNAYVLGYYAKGDGGEASYVISNSHTGTFYKTLSNGKYANLADEPKIISADVIGAKHYTTKANALADTASMTSNVTIIQAAINAGFGIKFGYGYYAFDNYLLMKPGCDILGVRRESTFLEFPNGIGLYFNTYHDFNYLNVKNFRINSLGNCIEVTSAVAGVIYSQFDNLWLTSEEGECIVAPRYNRGARANDTCVWSCFFGHINGSSETGAIFANISGLGNWFYFINVIGNTHIAFRNCSGVVQRLDTLTTRPYYCFYYDDVKTFGLSLTLIEVHFEGCNRSFIYTEDATASTMSLGVFSIDSGVSNLDPYIQEPLEYPFIKVGELSYLYSFGRNSMLPDERYFNMQALHGARIHITAFNSLASAEHFRTNVGGAEGLKIWASQGNGMLYTVHDDNRGCVRYQNEGITGFEMRSVHHAMSIDNIYGGRQLQIFEITDDMLPEGAAKNIDVKTIDASKLYCDCVSFKLTSDDVAVKIRSLKLGEVSPGKLLTVKNDATSTKNVRLEAVSGTTGYGFVYDSDFILEPGDVAHFILRYQEGSNNVVYTRWFPISYDKYVLPDATNAEKGGVMIESTPTQNSTKAITSGGVYSALNALESEVTVSGATPSITGVKNTRYICGTVTSISITPPNSGSIEVYFTSGSTAATVTMPRTVFVPSGFDPNNLATNTKYKIKIVDGVYGEVMTFVEQPYNNLLDPNEFIDGSVWWKGNPVTGYSDYCATPKIPVTPGKTYILKRDPGVQNYANWFDENEEYISQEAWVNNTTKTIADGVYYVGVSMLKTDMNNAIFAEY